MRAFDDPLFDDDDAEATGCGTDDGLLDLAPLSQLTRPDLEDIDRHPLDSEFWEQLQSREGPCADEPANDQPAAPGTRPRGAERDEPAPVEQVVTRNGATVICEMALDAGRSAPARSAPLPLSFWLSALARDAGQQAGLPELASAVLSAGVKAQTLDSARLGSRALERLGEKLTPGLIQVGCDELSLQALSLALELQGTHAARVRPLGLDPGDSRVLASSRALADATATALGGFLEQAWARSAAARVERTLGLLDELHPVHRPPRAAPASVVTPRSPAAAPRWAGGVPIWGLAAVVSLAAVAAALGWHLL